MQVLGAGLSRTTLRSVGWRPLPTAIPAGEMALLLEDLSGPERNRLLWSEDQPADQVGWYRRDDIGRSLRWIWAAVPATAEV